MMMMILPYPPERHQDDGVSKVRHVAPVALHMVAHCNQSTNKSHIRMLHAAECMDAESEGHTQVKYHPNYGMR